MKINHKNLLLSNFQAEIILWYDQNKRNLPWRDTKNPYKIWLSEIILQQTRVNQGLPYYIKFLEHFPDIFALAEADEKEILNLWQGLGYYSRARNLHYTAKDIADNYHGSFPRTYSEILKLKGIGEYTAAAIASFSFDEATAVLDGNVFRVLSRLFNVHEAIDTKEGKKIFKELAYDCLSKKNPSQYNQAIMEFGAIQCVPVNPECEVCPLQHMCLAFKNDTQKLLPVKSKKIKKRTRYFHFLVFLKNSSIILEQRVSKDVWKHLYQLPLIESDGEEVPAEILNLKYVNYGKTYKHILTHQNIIAQFYLIDSVRIEKDSEIVTPIENLENFPFPRLIDKFFKDLQLY